ncbi:MULTISPECIES: GntR family transcriptional regulator [unclassified Roseitalea]|uniref:GntR family transcriptional regulator n=1 Tax=unclassified Roseitalea TaxID=2639107 RepID=UPI00273EDC91|nr:MULTISPECIES: GntR family transcriptional regulator [unclassified Roseitalea]
MPRKAPHDAAFDLGGALAGASVARDSPIAPQIYALLRAAIIDGRLPPGTLVSEADLARIVSVSRTPLRAAIQRLAREGLVQVRPQAGTVVAPRDGARFDEALFVRRAIECAVVRRLAARSADLAALRPLLDQQRLAAERDDYRTFFAHDEAFHAELAALAGAPNGWSLVQTMKAHIDRERLVLMSSIEGRSLAAYRQHLGIVAAIEAGQGETAAARMAAHIDSVLETAGASGHDPAQPPPGEP